MGGIPSGSPARQTFIFGILLLLGIALSACSAGSVGEVGITVTVVNQTSGPICEVYVTTGVSNDWGRNLIPTGNDLAAGAERSFQQPAGTYDVLIRDCNGVPIQSLAKVNGNTTIPVGGTGMVPLTIDNAANSEVCYLYISNAADGSWGTDQLGGVESILPGAQRLVYVAPGNYRIKAENCAHEVLGATDGLEISAEMNWTVGNPLQ